MSRAAPPCLLSAVSVCLARAVAVTQSRENTTATGERERKRPLHYEKRSPLVSTMLLPQTSALCDSGLSLFITYDTCLPFLLWFCMQGFWKSERHYTNQQLQ